MSYRYMRILLMFDLPVQTAYERKEYSTFRKFLIKSGFLMLQESIYCKIVLNHSIMDSVIKNVKNNSPSKGLVQILKITEKQYAKMDYIIGEKKCEIIDSDERLIIL